MRTGRGRGGSDAAAAAASGAATRLPYTVELWDLTRTARERVIARAATLAMARTIFAAAGPEYLGRLLILRRGTEVIQRTE